MNSANPLNLGWINAGIELTYVHPITTTASMIMEY